MMGCALSTEFSRGNPAFFVPSPHERGTVASEVRLIPSQIFVRLARIDPFRI